MPRLYVGRHATRTRLEKRNKTRKPPLYGAANGNVKILLHMKTIRELFPKASNAFLKANEKALNSIAPDIRAADKAFTSDPPKRGRSMSNAELEYAMILEAMKRRGEIESYKYEGVTLKLADGCRFTPDFFVVVAKIGPKDLCELYSDHYRFRFIEVKGARIWDDSLVKFKVAKEQNPWADWQLHQKTRDGWTRLL